MARTTKLVPPAKSADIRQSNRCQALSNPTCELVELEREGDREEEELIAYGDEEGNGKIIVIKCVDLHCDKTNC